MFDSWCPGRWLTSSTMRATGQTSWPPASHHCPLLQKSSIRYTIQYYIVQRSDWPRALQYESYRSDKLTASITSLPPPAEKQYQVHSTVQSWLTNSSMRATGQTSWPPASNHCPLLQKSSTRYTVQYSTVHRTGLYSTLYRGDWSAALWELQVRHVDRQHHCGVQCTVLYSFQKTTNVSHKQLCR